MHTPSPHPALNRRTLLSAFTCLSASAVMPAFAQGDAAQFPGKLVTLVVPYSAGGGTDIIGRMLAQKLGELWGSQWSSKTAQARTA
ncbi:hypothetical protein [Diaphorobacter aerolatus]|uniref:hypothetical protein n=1 Tax=Diaphorobacter aerolatus TaxID=1288495 RepID=UPI001D0080E0|nr:hypothetical protein [Diaphorobacter aerolatus]